MMVIGIVGLRKPLESQGHIPRNCEVSRNFVSRHRIHTVYNSKRVTISKVERRTLMAKAYVQWVKKLCNVLS